MPNAETIEAMKAARRGELVTAGKPGDLLDEPECGLLNTRAASGATTAHGHCYWCETDALSRGAITPRSLRCARNAGWTAP